MRWSMGLIRLFGLFIVFSVALAGSPPLAVTAEETCEDYTMEPCVQAATCEELAENDCGAQAGPQCAEEGWVACGYWGGCPVGEVAMICQFTET